ncbi:hypothetical protein NDR87_00610 [Nocardia sp. CDC159]|uniref:Secreted protein n=1 Tax=Nocardia pulmonis TaxID=2951408 RepID=A0A9X2E1U5_9NOCA|nr:MULTISPECIES: hypothetical protein [Nocardia]MCM6772487.1 hypothetical protein [Nocardia pulmonis]MCM6784855.1 hypothetical protein [Nocardia sp. CDC159]
MSGAVLAVVIVVVVAAVLIVAALAARPALRRRRLRSRFGPEYDRMMQQAEDRRAAEAELAQRERRHARLELRPLSEQQKQRYQLEWARMQEQFVDDPAAALGAADRLVTAIMAERGYPTESHEQKVADLSVEHAEPLSGYRVAHDITVRAGDGVATTEDMRTAIVHYRELFADLLGTDPTPTSQPQ